MAELDLSGVELTVLSACQTALGATAGGRQAGGEGLLGLQRAFQVAGARGVVATLWDVDDEATRALMERFYANFWQKKLMRLEALREAQLWMLRAGWRREPAQPRSVESVPPKAPAGQPDHVPPDYWAAFVLSGDWR